MGRGSRRASGGIRNIRDAEGQGRVRINVRPLAQPKLGCKTQVQDRFPDDEAVLWRQGSAADPSRQGSRDGVSPKPSSKNGRFSLQRGGPELPGRVESELRPVKPENLFCKGLRSYDRTFI